jgi:hypothetical protein
MTPPDDLHEWLSFDLDDETYEFDVTFLTSRWTCIYGRGCRGVLTGPAPELEQGCCSYGAHFTGKDDRKRVERAARRLDPEEWQFHGEAAAAGGPIHRGEDGAWVTLLQDDACIFLNRPGFPAGAGCALHQGAVARGERFIDWKPDVCWEQKADDNGHTTNVLREWKRRDWGEGGFEFHWWCTDDPDAFVGDRMVYEGLRDEIVELVGEAAYEALADLLAARPRAQLLPHPALKKRG